MANKLKDAKSKQTNAIVECPNIFADIDNILRPNENDNIINGYRTFYDELNFIHGSCGIKWNAENHNKDCYSMPTTSQRLTTQPYNSSLTGYYIIPPNSNIIIIDIDHVELCEELQNLCFTYCKYVVQTLKGFHFYFKQRAGVKNTVQSKTLGFDIPNLIFCPPAYYYKDGIKIQYKFIANPVLVDMPDCIAEHINKLVKSKPQQIVVPQQITNQPQQITNQITELQRYKDLIFLIPELNQNYKDWIKIGMCLHNVKSSDEMRSIWFEWSKINYDADELEIQSKWTSFENNLDNPLTIATIIKYCKERNPNGYLDWHNQYEKNIILENYYWADFLKEFKDKIFPSYESMRRDVLSKIGNVFNLIKDFSGIAIIKQSNDDPCHIIKYNSNQKICNLKYNEIKEGETQIKKYAFNHFIDNHIDSLALFTSIVCNPNISTVKDYEFNLWQDFTAKEVEDVKINKIQIILTHIKEVWASNNEEYYNYLISWLAHIIQTPWNKTEIAVVLISKPGSGKTIITEFIEKYLFGKDKSVHVDDINQALGKFNIIMKNKLFVCIKEMATLKEEYHKMFDKFKSLITDSTINLEQKGIDIITLNNIANYIITTNNDFSIKIEESDRRYAVFKCSEKYINNREYFNALADALNQDTANHLFTYLKRYKININLRNIPESEYKKEIQEMSLSSSLRFLKAIKRREVEPVGYPDIKGQELFNSYSGWCKCNNEKPCSGTAFGRQIKDYIEKRKTMGFMLYDAISIKLV